MADFQLRQPANFQSILASNESAIFTDLEANPGTLASAIATRTGINATIISVVLKVFLQQQVAVRGVNIAGTQEVFWSAADWQFVLRTNRVGARTWLAANNGGVVSAMAVALGIHEAVAQALGLFLEREGSAKIVPQ